MNESDVLDRLMAQIHRRVAERPKGSYTTKLLEGGVEAITAKVREEAEEVVEAASMPTKEQLLYEACDLIYHLWVLLGAAGIDVDDVRRELTRREGTSGIAEKESRNNK